MNPKSYKEERLAWGQGDAQQVEALASKLNQLSKEKTDIHTCPLPNYMNVYLKLKRWMHLKAAKNEVGCRF